MTRPTVLVVDDEPDVVEVYAHDLADAYEVRTASGGGEALEEVDKSVDVVLLDRRMEPVSGDEALAAIRERDLDVYVVMVTAIEPDFDVVDLDFDGYVTKPVHGEELREAVDEVLALSAQNDRIRNLYEVVQKRVSLESVKSGAELAASAEYAELRERQSELEDETAARQDRRDDEFYRKLMGSLPDGDET